MKPGGPYVEKKVRTAVIGYGMISNIYLKNLKNLFHIIDLVAVAGRNVSAARARADAFGVERAMTIDEAAAAEAKGRLDGVRDEIAALEAAVAKDDAGIKRRKEEVDGLGNDLAKLLAKLDYPALVLVLAAITVSASDTMVSNDAHPDDEEKGAVKIPSPLDVVRESLKEAFEDICEEIAEKRMETV